jgi:hypothetical protein
MAAHGQSACERIDGNNLPRAEVVQGRVEQLPHRSLSDDDHDLVEHRRQLFQREDDGPERLGHQGLLVRDARIERNGPLLAQYVPLEKSLLRDRHSEHPLAGLEPLARRSHHGADHFVQRMADARRIEDVAVLKERNVRPAKTAKLGLEDDLARALG